MLIVGRSPPAVTAHADVLLAGARPHKHQVRHFCRERPSCFQSYGKPFGVRRQSPIEIEPFFVRPYESMVSFPTIGKQYMKRVAIYLRVSTTEQTVEKQQRELE